VADALVFEFMDLAMLALCIVVLAVPRGDGLPGTSATPDRSAFQTAVLTDRGCQRLHSGG